jgi:hypothetical protein
VWRVVYDPVGVVDARQAREEITVNPSYQTNPFTNNPVLSQLDNDAHRFALQSWCTAQGLSYDGRTNSCTAKDSLKCAARSNPAASLKDLTKFHARPPLIWTGTQCVRTYGNANLCSNNDLPYVATARVRCDDNEVCTAPAAAAPTCKLTRAYCNAKGVDFNGTGNGDCVLKVGQHIAEMIVGKTVTRTVRRRLESTYHSCEQGGPLSPICQDAVILYALGEVVVESVYEGYKQTIQKFNKSCIHGTSNAGRRVMDCVLDTLNFWPGFWLTDQCNNMLNGMFSLIPGWPIRLQFPIWISFIAPYAGKALDAIFKWGQAAGEAIYQAGEVAVRALEVAYDQTLSTFEDAGEALAAATGQFVDSVGNIAAAIARAGRDFAQHVVNIAAQGAAAVEELGKMMKVAFETGLTEMTQYVTRVLFQAGTAWVSAMKAVGKELGQLFGVKGTLFVQGLQALGGVLKDIGDAIGDAVSDAVCAIGLC